jgi:hypothetical protein
MIKVNDYKCPKCGFLTERFEDGTVDEVEVPCARQCSTLCTVYRQISTPAFRIDVEARKYVPGHVRRARALGHGGSNAAREGAYDNDDPKNYQKKIMVGAK